ncbi:MULTISPECIES: lipoyl(octanoyl) transferase LipB [Pseudomonadaceae]|uniref:lipoyl(octanoyl) transferase LipB n=1 Tax=Pseudomonadaceae TaxID=135621 RepID=UPI0015E43109|nr:MULTISPECIES: lipoyl(octanoyl) transferase LipB [Pseudomonadaceae]MBA1276675.1 lipoyl(octanoyl) transferase LipB [Stutzerimonas stutzeri]MBC8649179.1 lipoyl(octanoyl) transferase LipB [Pseudomonas sp. MT4]QXY93131.1 lipoyl(octanoyl) transferase LipB [Pseudomonas sp. MTM4]
MASATLGVRDLGLVEYEPTWQAMQRFTNERVPTTKDEIWLLQHPPVFTQGQAGKAEHLLLPGDIPVVQVDRGGQVTYHGPGQLVCYLMLDVRRLGIGVRELVSRIEQSLIDLLASYDVQALAKPDAPGVYVEGAKIASLGLRIRNGRSFHGLALNVDMDLEPFRRINPCGHAGLSMTQLADLVARPVAFSEVGARLREQLVKHLGYAELQTL